MNNNTNNQERILTTKDLKNLRKLEIRNIVYSKLFKYLLKNQVIGNIDFARKEILSKIYTKLTNPGIRDLVYLIQNSSFIFSKHKFNNLEHIYSLNKLFSFGSRGGSKTMKGLCSFYKLDDPVHIFDAICKCIFKEVNDALDEIISHQNDQKVVFNRLIIAMKLFDLILNFGPYDLTLRVTVQECQNFQTFTSAILSSYLKTVTKNNSISVTYENVHQWLQRVTVLNKNNIPAILLDFVNIEKFIQFLQNN